MATAPDSFFIVLPVTLHEEGGFANDPDDPGGITNYGVTKVVWESWIGHPVTLQDMRNLTVGMVTPLYRSRYFNATGCPRLPTGLALCVFDFAVNSGDGRAVMELQKLIGVPADGHFGDQTFNAVQKFLPAAKASLINQYQARRQAFDQSLEGYARYGNDWSARVKRINAKALTL